MAKNTFKVGLIGCGRIASTLDDDPKRKYISTHIGAYKYAKSTDITAVCDRDTKKLRKCQEKWNIPRGYTDFKEMLKKEKPDILSICTPHDTHYAILKEAAKFPLKAVFCEKPLADTIKNAKRIVGLYKRKKILLQINHQRRFDPLHLKIREIIRDRKLGGVQQVNFYYTAGIKNTGSHMFDLLRFLFGDAEWIKGIYSRNLSHNPSDPNVDGILRFKSGVLTTFQACDVKRYSIFELNCLLQKGRIVIGDHGFSADLYKVVKHKYFSGYKQLHKRREPVKMSYKRDFMINAVNHLVRCIKEKKCSGSSGIDGSRAVELTEGALNSAGKNGKRIILR